MSVKLLLILSLFYGSTIHGQTEKSFNSIKEFGEFFDNSWKHHTTKGVENPKYLTEKIDNCLLSINIETNNSIRLVFVDKKTIQEVRNNRKNVNMESLPKGFLCYGVTSGVKIIKTGDKFLFDSDGHHISTSLKLIEINKKQAVFEYTNSGFFGYMNYSSKKIGNLNLELN